MEAGFRDGTFVFGKGGSCEGHSGIPVGGSVLVVSVVEGTLEDDGSQTSLSVVRDQ